MTAVTMPSAEKLVTASIRICRRRGMTETQACQLVMDIASALIGDEETSPNGPSAWLLEVHQTAWRRMPRTRPRARQPRA